MLIRSALFGRALAQFSRFRGKSEHVNIYCTPSTPIVTNPTSITFYIVMHSNPSWAEPNQKTIWSIQCDFWWSGVNKSRSTKRWNGLVTAEDGPVILLLGGKKPNWLVIESITHRVFLLNIFFFILLKLETDVLRNKSLHCSQKTRQATGKTTSKKMLPTCKNKITYDQYHKLRALPQF